MQIISSVHTEETPGFQKNDHVVLLFVKKKLLYLRKFQTYTKVERKYNESPSIHYSASVTY